MPTLTDQNQNQNQNNITVNVAAPVYSPQAMNITVVNKSNDPSFAVRAFYFLVVGWWLSGLAIVAAYVAFLTVVGIPVGIMILNRLPQITTLKPRGNSIGVSHANGQTVVTVSGTEQYPFWLRAVYFIVCGLWVTSAWLVVAWVFGLTIIGLPVALWMYDRTPAVLTLQKN